MEPFTYKDSVYAIPATQSFDMMFVRTDIFKQLGLDVPETWQELITVTIPVLQRKNLSVGLGVLNKSANINSSNLFYTLLYQNGGSLYTEDRLKTNMSTSSSLEALIERYLSIGNIVFRKNMISLIVLEQAKVL